MIVVSVALFLVLAIILFCKNAGDLKAYDKGFESKTGSDVISTDMVSFANDTEHKNSQECSYTISTNSDKTTSVDYSPKNEETTAGTTHITCDTTQATEVITTSSQQDSTLDVDTTSTITTVHTHSYVMTSSCMYHPEEGHYEEVCVTEGYSEDIYEYYDKYCYYCGTIMDDWGFEEILDHSSIHGAYGTYKLLVDSIWHEPVYEQVWVVDVEGYYEEEVVVECIDCGYIERSKYYGD